MWQKCKMGEVSNQFMEEMYENRLLAPTEQSLWEHAYISDKVAQILEGTDLGLKPTSWKMAKERWKHLFIDGASVMPNNNNRGRPFTYSFSDKIDLYILIQF